MKIIIIDDEPLARSIVKEYLAYYPDIKVMAECNDGFEGMKAIQQHEPDLIFLDIQMPKINALKCLNYLMSRGRLFLPLHLMNLPLRPLN